MKKENLLPWHKTLLNKMKEQILNYIYERKSLLEEELELHSYQGDTDSIEAAILINQIEILEELWSEIKSLN